ncbi:DEKNAAC105633 [Brettanomyces naardenensis]|uniref:Large ribosomal subunit protein mL50 n=1 Tax=Brettanomyces naardenensis TaxID=13370 RepID=A0A448YTR6_BRENA|nr:DEKNAAC105633 [Brettanomyces naardenensis]
MLLRSLVRPARQVAPVSAVRLFSSTQASSSILDYFKFYRNKEVDVPKPRPTEEVIKEVESGKKIDVGSEVEIIGRRDPRQSDKSVILKNLKGFTIHSWVPKTTIYSSKQKASSPEKYTQTVSELLREIYSANFDDAKLEQFSSLELNDLSRRFQILKEVQEKFGVEIPDPRIAGLNTFGKIERYLTEKLDPTRIPEDELVPDKVYFDPASFEGTNISVGDFVFEKQKSKTLKKLLKKANKLERKAMEQHRDVTETSTV